jgi:hypothetical protein
LEELAQHNNKSTVKYSDTMYQTLQEPQRKIRSWDSSVGIAMGYGLDDPGSIPSSARFSSSLKHPD